MTWTPDRPTKPGKYWLSIHPDKRPGEQHPDVLFPAVIACEVTQVVEWMLGEENANALDHEQFSRVWAVKYRSGGAWLRLADAWFDRALWRPYVEPADPFAESVPSLPSLRRRVEALMRFVSQPMPEDGPEARDRMMLKLTCAWLLTEDDRYPQDSVTS